MTFGEKLLELRRAHGMSQDALAEQLNVSRQAVSKSERDEAAPETDKIIKLAQLFHVSTDYLLLDAPERPRQEVPPQQSPPSSRPNTSTADRVERFIRRHGYKAGYVLMTIGIIICLFSVGLRMLWPVVANGFFSGTLDSFGSLMDGGSSALGDLGSYGGDGQILDPDGNVIGSWQEILGDAPIVDENGNQYSSLEEFLGGGSDGFTSLNPFDQIANQALSSAIHAQANMFLLGLIPGLLMIAAGIFVVVKAKKYALEEIPK